MVMLCLATIITAMPTFSLDNRPNNPAIEVSSPGMPSAYEAVPRTLQKRHDYYVLCSQYMQDGNSKTPFEGQPDIKLSRTCLGSPYTYTCKAGECIAILAPEKRRLI